jgi:hypothetical protein
MGELGFTQALRNLTPQCGGRLDTE